MQEPNIVECNKCIHRNTSNNEEIGFGACSGEYCDFKFKAVKNN